MKAGLIIVLILAVLIIPMGNLVQAEAIIPPLPQAFYGNVTINGSAAPAGTVVTVTGSGVRTGYSGNPLTTTQSGKYGASGPTGTKLIVQGLIADETTLTFEVNGIVADTAKFESGKTQQLDLSVADNNNNENNGNTGNTIKVSPTSAFFNINMIFFGQTFTFQVDSTGALIQSASFTAPGSNLVVTIPKGTILKDQSNNILTTITIKIHGNPPALPEGMIALGKALEFTPDGATFTPPISLQFSFNPGDLPAGVSGKDLVVQYYNSSSGKWEALTGIIDLVKSTITVQVSHLCAFAIVYTLPPESPAPTGAIASVPAVTSTIPTKTDPVATLNTTVTSSVPATVSPSPYVQASETQLTPETKNNSSMYLLIGAGLVLICLVVLFVIIRRNRA